MAGDILMKLRKGVPPHKNIVLGNGDDAVNITIVLLSSDNTQKLDELTEEYANNNKNKINVQVRNEFYNRMLCSMCMRDPDDKTLDKQIITYEEVGNLLDIEDIKRICSAYQELLVNKAPKIELLDEEQLEEIKNYLEVTQLKDLSTVLLVHLKSCHQTIVSEK